MIQDQVFHCGHFLVIKDREVGLIHQSAKEYLLREACDPNPELECFRIQEKARNLEIASTCFEYIQNGALADGPVNLREDVSRLEAFPLLSYAALHWPKHAKSLPRSDYIFNLSHPFYSNNSWVRVSWLMTYSRSMPLEPPEDSCGLLQLASWFGILPLVENILLQEGFINRIKRSYYLNYQFRGTPLRRAASRGHLAIVRLLLDNGAYVDMKDEIDRTAIYEAAWRGYKEVVQLLIEYGASIEGVFESPLNSAAFSGNEDMLLFLLEKGANIESRFDHETALHTAARSGRMAVLRLLLEKAADIEAKGSHGMTALHLAALGGQEAIVELLLKEGADIEAQNNHGKAALYMAASNNEKAVVRLLLNKGARIRVKNNQEQEVLDLAAQKGPQAFVRSFLDLEKPLDPLY